MSAAQYDELAAAPDAPRGMLLCQKLAQMVHEKDNVPAFNSLFDRAYGKPKETVMLGGDPDNPVRLQTEEEKRKRIDILQRARNEYDRTKGKK